MSAEPTPFDRPSAAELVSAVRDELDGLIDRLEGRDRWLVRIAANALAIAGRELELGPAMTAAHHDRLAAFDCSDDHALSAAIRRGTLDDRLTEVGAALWATALDKLQVANPGYLDLGHEALDRARVSTD
jgi:hypothetical protein